MKKIIFFTYDFPFPTNTGGKNRAYNMLKFAGKDLEIHLFSFTRSDFDPVYIKEIEKLGVASIEIFKRRGIKNPYALVSALHPKSSVFRGLYYDSRVLAKLKEKVITENIGAIHFESFYTGFYINNQLKANGIKQIFGTENIEYLIYKDYAQIIAKPSLKPVFSYQAFKIKKEEERFMNAADICISVTEEEARYIKEVSKKDCFVIPNGIDSEYFAFKPKKRKNHINILFVGNFSYFPNVDAVHFFYKNVFMKLTNFNTTFTIVGKYSTRLSCLGDPRTRIVEFIDDIRNVYYDADIFVFPLRIGGGTNFKVLEAMSCGVPIVALPERVEGLAVKNHEHMLFAKDVDEFRSKVQLLMTDRILASKIARNAREIVEEKYSWNIIGKDLNKIWKNL